MTDDWNCRGVLWNFIYKWVKCLDFVTFIWLFLESLILNIWCEYIVELEKSRIVFIKLELYNVYKSQWKYIQIRGRLYNKMSKGFMKT